MVAVVGGLAYTGFVLMSSGSGSALTLAPADEVSLLQDEIIKDTGSMTSRVSEASTSLGANQDLQYDDEEEEGDVDELFKDTSSL
jgi:hypothetical protein